MKKHIVIIEDDADIAEEMAECLVEDGFLVSSVDSVEHAEEVVQTAPAELIVIDIGLPGMDGLTYAREVRAKSRVGMILVTGRTSEIDRVIGLEVGADDYVCKPFSARELLARVRSVLRRTEGNQYPAEQVAADAPLVFAFDGWKLNTFTRELYGPDGRIMHLTTAEFEMLRTFLESPNRVYNRDYLSYQIFGREASPVSRAIDGLISRLRKKLDADGETEGSFIKTVRGAGYIFTGRVSLHKN